jgi:hypothetical protein
MDNRDRFLDIVRQWVYEHPEDVYAIQRAVQDAVTSRLDYEQRLRARAETALSIVHIYAKKVPPAQQEIVDTALIDAAMFQGTEFQRKLIARRKNDANSS